MTDNAGQWGMRIESALIVTRVNVRLCSDVKRAILLTIPVDETRVQRAHLARLRAPHLCAHPDEDGQGGHVVQGGATVAQGALLFSFTRVCNGR